MLDDAPVAADETVQVVAEDAEGTISGNVLTNDTPGADGASLTHVELPGGGGFVAITTGTQGPDGVFSFTVGVGTYTFKADGGWTFDPANNQVSPSSAASITASPTATATPTRRRSRSR